MGTEHDEMSFRNLLKELERANPDAEFFAEERTSYRCIFGNAVGSTLTLPEGFHFDVKKNWIYSLNDRNSRTDYFCRPEFFHGMAFPNKHSNEDLKSSLFKKFGNHQKRM